MQLKQLQHLHTDSGESESKRPIKPSSKMDSIYIQENDTIEIRPTGSGEARTLASSTGYFTVTWVSRRLNAVLLLFESQVSHTPRLVWLTRQTPWCFCLPLPLSRCKMTAYGLSEWKDQHNYKVESSSETEWNTRDSISFCTTLQNHHESRSILHRPRDAGTASFSLDMDKSGSYVEGLPTAGMSTSTQGLLLCTQHQDQDQGFQEWVLLRGQPLRSLPQLNLQALLPSRRKVSIRLLALRPQPAQLLLLDSASSIIDVHMYMNRDDLQQLQLKALEYRKIQSLEKPNKTVTLKHFFRNKPPEYFDNISKNQGGLMTTYLKDNNGDPDSCINHNIEGLFFSASPAYKTKKPPRTSPFGKKRLLVPAHILFTETSCLYFADFYCTTSEHHYVTLVLTEAGSPADDFCRRRLLPLDPRANPFLTRMPSLEEAKVQTTLTLKMKIEVLYTEHVDIKQLLEVCRDQVFGKSKSCNTSKKDGYLKNASCPHCNLGQPVS